MGTGIEIDRLILKLFNCTWVSGQNFYKNEIFYFEQWPRTDRTFLFFLGVTSGILCATVYFFSTILGPFSHNLDRDKGPRSRFSELFSGYIVPRLFAKISSKNRFLATFCELLFDFLTLLGVSVIDSLINGEQKLD